MTFLLPTTRLTLALGAFLLLQGCFKAPNYYYSSEYATQKNQYETVEELEYNQVYRLGEPEVNLEYEKPKPVARSSRKDRVFEHEDVIRAAAKKYSVDYYLLMAVVQSESAGDPRAVSSANCLGLTQLAVPTARDYEPNVRPEELFDPETNLDIAGRHMAKLNRLIRNRFPNADLEQRVILNAAAWNAGWGRVKKYNGTPNFRETQQFTRRVIHYYRKYRWGKLS